MQRKRSQKDMGNWQRGRPRIPEHNGFVKNRHLCPSCKYDFVCQVGNVVSNYDGPHSFMEGVDQARQPKKVFGPKYERIPLLLECGHSVCELCIRREVDIHKKIKCSQCLVVHEENNIPKNIYERFPINFYLLGVLYYEKSQVKRDVVGFQPVRQNSSIAAKFSNPPEFQNKAVDTNRPLCNECRNFNAESHCEQCKLNLCKSCFSIIHRPKCFNHHVAIPVAQAMLLQSVQAFELPACSVHTAHGLEFFCTDCKFEICRNCVITAHQGHKISEVGEMNKGFKDEFVGKEPLCREIKSLLENTIKKVENKLQQPHHSKNTNTIQKQIDDHFHLIFAKVQLCENRIRNEVATEMTKTKHQLEKIYEELQYDHKTITNILNQMSLVDNPKHIAQMNLKQLLNDLERISSNRKRHLVENIGEDQINLLVDDDFLNGIDSHCSLHSNIQNSFYLAAEDELPEGYLSSDISASDISMESLLEKTEITRSNDSLSVKSMYLPKRKYHENENITKKPLIEDACVPVYLSHIKDPSLFYVQHLVDANNHNKFINKYTVSAKKSKTPTPDEVEQNGLYFVYFENDKLYYRGQIKQIIQNENGETTYDVFYIDYGNHKCVSIEKLRIMSPEFKNEPPKAHLCTLYDIIPKNEVWSEEAIHLVLRMINQSPVYMQIMKISGNKHYVDLLTIPTESSETRTSIRDALIILELACFANPASYNTHKPKISLHENDFFQRSFSSNEVVAVECCHIVDPSHFYVQIVDYKPIIGGLKEKMSQTYSEMGRKGTIYTPREGMLCAVKDDNSWYRGKITRIPGNREVEVFLVDSGHTKIVFWEQIRTLQDDFLKIHAQAVKCKLHDVESPTPDWSSEAVIAFIEMIKAVKVLKMEVSTNSNPKPVILYEVLDKMDRNLNALFVQSGFGRSTGIGSKCVEYHHEEEVSPTKKEVKSNTQNKLKKPLKLKSKRAILIEPVEEKTVTPTVIAKKGEPIRVQVIVLLVVSPGCVYIRLSHHNPELLELQMKMNEFYKNKSYDPNHEWKSQDKCAVCVHQKWYRAIIENIDETVKVFIKDIAQEEEVSKKQLRVLDTSFLGVRDGSMKCELFGIQPAGGKTWPMLACEELREIVNLYSEVYITKRGDVTANRSLPVDIWVQHRTLGGALEPSKVEWLKVNDMLIEKGLVMPIRQTVVTEVVSEEKPEVTDWLTLAELDLSSPTYINEHWSPFEFLKKSKFRGVVTHVDEDLTIYLHDEFVNSTLDKISTSLEFNFRDSKCHVEDMFWSVGCICIAKDDETDLYYRGIVKKVDNSEILVNCIDYGFNITCRAVNLRKKIILSEIPIQAYKCQLHKLAPSPLYLADNEIDYAYHPDCIQFVKDALLNKTVMIKVSEVLDNFLSIKVTYDDCDLIDQLIEKDWAMTTEEFLETSDNEILESLSVIKLDSDSSSIETTVAYQLITLPVGLTELKLHISSAGDSLLTWYVRLEGKIAENLGKRSSYDELMVEIQSEANELPIIRNPEEGQACIALYGEDSNWYRGEILKPIYQNSDTLFVIFTDFGNTEIVPRKNVRYIKPQWLMVPMQCLVCKISALEINADVENFKELADDFRDQLYDQVYTAKVVQLEPLTVELYEDGKLAFEDFIDRGLFVKV